MYDCYRLCFAAFEIQLSWRIRGTAAAAGCYTRGTQFVGYAPISTAEPATLLQRQCGELRGAGAVRHIYAEQVSGFATIERWMCFVFNPPQRLPGGQRSSARPARPAFRSLRLTFDINKTGGGNGINLNAEIDERPAKAPLPRH
jgi:hypothetical protein